MRDLAYLWEEEKHLEDRFAIFVVVSIILHAALIPFCVGASRAIDLKVKDVQPKPAIGGESPHRAVLFSTRKVEPERPAFQPRIVPTTTVRQEQLPKAPRHPQMQAPPEKARETQEPPVPPEQASETQALLLETPEAPTKELPTVTEHQPTALPEEPWVPVREKHVLLAQKARDVERRFAQEQPRRELHPKRSLLSDPVPSEKPQIPILDTPVRLAEIDLPRIMAGSPGEASSPGKAREASLEARISSASASEHARAASLRALLPLPGLSVPRVPLEGIGELPEGWTREGLDAYKAALQEMLKKVRYYPRRSLLKEEQGVVTLRFVLDRTGTLENAYVHMSSQHPLLDSAGMDMVRKASPYPPFPSKVRSQSILFEVDIIFSIGG
ncbi:MAG: TonB family protein [Planctomycetota bacterium]